MRNRTDKAVARAGALDRVEALLTEAKQALDKAVEELKTIDGPTSQSLCDVHNDTGAAAACVASALKVMPDVS